MILKPRSLAGQMLLLVAVALIIAQAINLAFLLSEARARRANFVEGGAIARTVDAVERAGSGQAIGPERDAGRARAIVTSGAPAAVVEDRDPQFEARVAQALSEARLVTGQVRAGRSENERGPDSLLVSVQLPDGRWVTTRSRAPPSSFRLVAPLVGQTIVLLLTLLIAVMLIGRRVARPLNRLAEAAETFGTTARREPVQPQGPSDVQRLIGTFNQMQTRILDMLDEKDRMLGAIGHDLRTPLASLRLRAEAVDDEQERQKMVDTINELGRTLEDILSLARLGRSNEEQVRVDLNALVDALVADLQDLGIAVEFTSSERLLAFIRPLLIRRAIRNLVENAVNYGRRADVRLLAEGGEAVLLVDDQGPGIPEADLERVMGGFVRLDESRNRGTGGSGLGLTIARSIIHEHGGSLSLENLPEGGLRATVRLPIEHSTGHKVVEAAQVRQNRRSS